MNELGMLAAIFGAAYLGRIRFRYWMTTKQGDIAPGDCYGMGAWLVDVTLIALAAGFICAWLAGA